MSLRIGTGIDAHALVADRKLYLGGIEIPADKGSAGHSDGDVLIHVICDALLGSVNLGDLGQHFPSSESKLKDVSSKKLLEHVMKMLNNYGTRIVNLDATVIIQDPPVSKFIPEIRASLSGLLNISEDLISIKAKTTDLLGFTGRGEGLAAICTVLVESE